MFVTCDNFCPNLIFESKAIDHPNDQPIRLIRLHFGKLQIFCFDICYKTFTAVFNSTILQASVFVMSDHFLNSLIFESNTRDYTNDEPFRR